MNTAIEIHDSRVIGVAMEGGKTVVHFKPAYLHKSTGRPAVDSGTGWVQDANLIFNDGIISGDFPEWPCDIMEGDLIVGSKIFANLIPLPLEVTAPTKLVLVCDVKHTLTVSGRGVKLELIGDPKYVEVFKS
jgi:hypothetical protein